MLVVLVSFLIRIVIDYILTIDYEWIRRTQMTCCLLVLNASIEETMLSTRAMRKAAG